MSVSTFLDALLYMEHNGRNWRLGIPVDSMIMTLEATSLKHQVYYSQSPF